MRNPNLTSTEFIVVGLASPGQCTKVRDNVPVILHTTFPFYCCRCAYFPPVHGAISGAAADDVFRESW